MRKYTVIAAMLAIAAICTAYTATVEYVFRGKANEALQTTIESGLANQSVTHAKNQLGVDSTVLNWLPGQCPVQTINLSCRVVEGERKWDWEYKVKRLSVTAVPAAD